MLNAYADSKALYLGKSNAAVLMSEKDKYRFSLYMDTKNNKIPLRKIHNWILHIETKDGEPVENAKVYIFGGMPSHRHGFSTKPRVKKYLGEGNYLVEGIKFSMRGNWEMRFNIKDKRQRGRVIFEINL